MVFLMKTELINKELQRIILVLNTAIVSEGEQGGIRHND